MTLDERLEALTHRVELLSQMHQDNETADQRRAREYQKRFLQILDAIEKLTTIAASHEERLENLENGNR